MFICRTADIGEESKESKKKSSYSKNRQVRGGVCWRPDCSHGPSGSELAPRPATVSGVQCCSTFARKWPQSGRDRSGSHPAASTSSSLFIFQPSPPQPFCYLPCPPPNSRGRPPTLSPASLPSLFPIALRVDFPVFPERVRFVSVHSRLVGHLFVVFDGARR